MSCLKKIIIGFGILSPVLLSVFFVSPSYAISDYSVSFDSSSTVLPLIICNDYNSSVPNCSDFSYLSFTPGSNNQFGYFPLVFISYSLGGSSSFRFPKSLTWSTSFSHDVTSVEMNTANGLRSGTFTLSQSLPGSTSCPDPEPCPSCPIIPENPYDNKFDEIKYAIYIIPAVLLLLYFFFCVYNIIIKNSGVKS